MKKSLYAQYILEREGVDTVETENYFFNYKIIENEFHVLDMFVREEFRCSLLVKEMMDLIDQMALDSGSKYLVSSVIAGLPNSEKSASLQFRYGMKFFKCDGNKIILLKEIK